VLATRPSDELDEWARTIEMLQVAVPVYVLINNHHEGHSPGTARKLQRMRGIRTVEPDELRPQMDLL
jgi:uncharacterized protein YecE (DUF72 family)